MLSHPCSFFRPISHSYHTCEKQSSSPEDSSPEDGSPEDSSPEDRRADHNTDTSINVRDNILRQNLHDGTPAQFIYEPANCRLFYTPAMMGNVTALWEAAAEAAWGGGSCVAGNIGAGSNSTLSRRAGMYRRGGRPMAAGAGAGAGAESVVRRGVLDMGDAAEPLVRSTFWQARHGRKVPE